MKTSTLIVGGLVVAGAVGVAMAMGGDDETGSGVSVSGDCSEFTVTDWDAWMAQAQVSFKSLWESGVRDPDDMIVGLWKGAVPQCEWPPKAGTAARTKWDTNMGQLRQHIQQIIDQLVAAEGGAIQMTAAGAATSASQAARRIGAVFGITVTTATLNV